MKIVTYNLKTGGRINQETKEQKMQKAWDYIEKLRAEDKVIEVIEEENRFVIHLED
jgi:hypothetical protein